MTPDPVIEPQAGSDNVARVSVQPSGPGHPGPLGRPYLPITLSILALVTVVAFESMAVSTAMPDVARELQAVRSYGFAFSVMLTTQLLGIVLAGVWSDRSGPLPGTFVAQAFVAGGSALCAVAGRFDIFLVGRALTGLGGGLLMVMMYVIAGRMYPEAIRPKLFTYVSAAWVLPSLLGAPIAAFLTTQASWRWVFWIVVPPILATIVVLARLNRTIDTTSLRERVSTRDHSAHVKAAWSGLGIAVAAGLLQLGSAREGAGDTITGARTVLGLAGLAGIVLIAPLLVPKGTWVMRRGLPSVILARALFTATFFAAISYIPLFLHGQRGASLQLAGLALAVGSLGWAVGSWYQGHDRLRIPRHRLVELGGMLLTFGLLALSAIAWLNIKAVLVVLALIVAGLAMGLGVTTTTVLALELSSLEQQAETSSQLQLADVLGSVLGISVVTGVFAAFHVQDHDNPLYGMLFLGLALVAALAIPAGQRIRT